MALGFSSGSSLGSALGFSSGSWLGSALSFGLSSGSVSGGGVGFSVAKPTVACGGTAEALGGGVAPVSYTHLEAGYSKNHIINMFKSQLGATPSQYVIQVRVNAAKQMLLYSDMSVAAIGQYLGYKDTAYFSRQFKAVTGYPPLQYRNWVGMDATV